ncbi:hypothetical protein EDD16DRAFT_1776395 [Pisolithus croceorrhizus]|nr:hypothetical protein EDD16DRAFT_1776395 [Pisolithus croceorrhizus]KAI6115264.1 hypothetical protein EV401DRAFT_1889596 [Pisolithus croceorrhizus]KAI6163849.1 hypothetical protein EDD17DRAFT_1507127 [Pisolithus thermaeus]
MSTKQLEGFSLTEVAHEMEAGAPRWWRLLGVLLHDKGMADMAGQKAGHECTDDMPEVEGDIDDYWDEVDEIDLEGLINGLTGEWSACSKTKGRQAECCTALKLMNE